MGRYRARDAINGPSIISWLRAPLAALFPFVVERPWLAVLVLFIAGASDVVDGWLARTTGQVTATGAVIDPITDKLFVLSVVVALVVTGKLPLYAVVLLSVRELGEAPLVLWYAASRKMRRARVEAPMANWPGKVATVLQFVTVTLAIVGAPLQWTQRALLVTAFVGALAAIRYFVRSVHAHAQA